MGKIRRFRWGSTGKIVGTQCHRADATGAGVMLSCAGTDVLIPATVAPV